MDALEVEVQLYICCTALTIFPQRSCSLLTLLGYFMFAADGAVEICLDAAINGAERLQPCVAVDSSQRMK